MRFIESCLRAQLHAVVLFMVGWSAIAPSHANGVAGAKKILETVGRVHAPARAIRSSAELPAQFVTPSALMNWAESAYPELFPSRSTNVLYESLIYRYYERTGNFLAIAGDRILVLGPFTGDKVIDVGALDDFRCAVVPASCAGDRLTFTREPGDVNTTAGSRVTLWAEIDKPQQALLQWYRNDIAISGADGTSYSPPALTMADDGAVYHVQARNGASAVRSASATVRVRPGTVPATRILVGWAGAVESNSRLEWASGARNIASRELVFVDAVRPQAPLLIERAGTVEWYPASMDQPFAPLAVNGYQLTRFDSVPDLRPLGERYAVYAKDQRLWAVDLDRAQQWSGPQRLSSASTQNLCRNGLIQFDDKVYPERSVLLFGRPTSNYCAGDTRARWAVLAGMDAATAPIAVDNVLDVLRSGDGAIDGYLVWAGATLVRTDHRFEPQQVLMGVHSRIPPEIVVNEWGRDGGWLVVRDGRTQLLGMRWRAPNSTQVLAPTERLDVQPVTMLTPALGPLLYRDNYDLRLLDLGASAAPRTLLTLHSSAIRNIGSEGDTATIENDGRLIAIDSAGSVRTIARGFNDTRGLQGCARTATRHVCYTSSGAGVFAMPHANPASMLWLGVGAARAVVGERVWGNNDRPDAPYYSIRTDGTGAMTQAGAMIVRHARWGSDESRFNGLTLDGEWDYSGYTIALATHPSGKFFDWPLGRWLVLDGRSGEMIADYGTPPLQTSASLRASPFNAAAVTGEPRLVSIRGIDVRSRDRVDLFIVHGNASGITRVTSHLRD